MFCNGLSNESVTLQNNTVYDLQSIYFSITFKVGLSPSKMMKNAFYFILKALLVLKILKFLSKLFGHVEKTA